MSARFGRLEVPEDRVLTFAAGLLGFEQAHRFVIFDHDADSPFKWLQSIDDPELAFVVISPFEFAPGYEFELGRDDAEKLGLKDSQSAALLVLVVIPEKAAEMTANLQGPLVLNVGTRQGRQVVLADGRYSTRTPILAALAEGRQAAKTQSGGTTLKSRCEREHAPMVSVAR